MRSQRRNQFHDSARPRAVPFRMPTARRGLSLVAVATLVAALSTVLPARPAAAHGGDATKIHGCVILSTLLLRIVGPNQNCLPVLEAPLDWNIKGPTGAKGATGAGGTSGPVGAERVQPALRARRVRLASLVRLG